jgi:hypothetical protein
VARGEGARRRSQRYGVGATPLQWAAARDGLAVPPLSHSALGDGERRVSLQRGRRRCQEGGWTPPSSGIGQGRTSEGWGRGGAARCEGRRWWWRPAATAIGGKGGARTRAGTDARRRRGGVALLKYLDSIGIKIGMYNLYRVY